MEDWQRATVETTARIQAVFRASKVPAAARLGLYQLSHEIVLSSGPHGASQYWSRFINVLRILATGLTTTDPEALFEE